MQLQDSDFYKQPAEEAKQGAAGTKSLGPTEERA